MNQPRERLTIEDVARYPRPGMVFPGSPSFTPDGQSVLSLYSDEGSLVRSLWAYDVATGERRVVVAPPERARTEEHLSREEELRRERARQRETGITGYRIAPDAEELTIIVPVLGSVWLQRGDAEVVEVAGTEGAIDPRPSRDGRRLAFVRDGELWVTDLDGNSEPRQLTTGAEPGLTHGLAEFIAQEELDRAEGFWWSRDGRWLAFEEADERHIPVYPIVHQGTDRPEIEEHRYPFAGDANARVRLGVVPVEGGEPRWLDPGEWEYLARVAWTHDHQLAVQMLSRDQRSATWYRFDPDTGARTTLIEDHQEPWYNLDHDMHFLPSGEIVRTSEATSFRHIEVHDRDGALIRRLTDGDWVVTGILHVDEERRLVYFSSTQESVRERHVYRVPIDGGEIERLTFEPGIHSASFAKDGSRFIDTHHSVEQAPSAILRDANGTALATLFDRSADAESLGLQVPHFIPFEAEDGTRLEGALYQARGNDGSKRPLVVSVYGGPHAQRVLNSWGMTIDLRAQYLAQQGLHVLVVDNRGSTDRGLAFEGHLARRMGEIEVRDQAAAVRQLAAQRDDIDLERVGIYGWSYGGYMTLMCMLKEPDLFCVGVAGAPVTDWDGYDTGYTERYLGTPQDNAEGYALSSTLPLAGQLEGKLLIVHGMIDENVHFRHTARLMKKLSEAQKRFDTLLFPEERHMPREARGLEYQERVVLDYLVRNLRD